METEQLREKRRLKILARISDSDKQQFTKQQHQYQQSLTQPDVYQKYANKQKLKKSQIFIARVRSVAMIILGLLTALINRLQYQPKFSPVLIVLTLQLVLFVSNQITYKDNDTLFQGQYLSKFKHIDRFKQIAVALLQILREISQLILVAIFASLFI